jgi:dUTP pyrophosphatase
MNVKVKKLKVGVDVPKYAKTGDAGLDLVATSKVVTNTYIEYGTSLAFQIPQGFVGLLYPRSSISKYDLVLANSVGVVDSGYRGEVRLRFKKTDDTIFCRTYDIGDKVAQLIIVPYPEITLQEVEELSGTERGTGGFGSTGL